MTAGALNLVWWYRRWPAAESAPVEPAEAAAGVRKGHPRRVLARGRGPGPRNVLVEFADGEKVVGSRFCVRRIS